jgi:hypothetical protein
MGALRTVLRDHRRLAGLLLALAITMKALVPAGFMVGQHATVLTIEICADTLGAKVTKQIIVPQQGGAHGKVQGDPAKPSGSCPFGVLAMATLTGADVVLLAAALAFILVLGFAPPNVVPSRKFARALPPLRGPPAFA